MEIHKVCRRQMSGDPLGQSRAVVGFVHHCHTSPTVKDSRWIPPTTSTKSLAAMGNLLSLHSFGARGKNSCAHCCAGRVTGWIVKIFSRLRMMKSHCGDSCRVLSAKSGISLRESFSLSIGDPF